MLIHVSDVTLLFFATLFYLQRPAQVPSLCITYMYLHTVDTHKSDKHLKPQSLDVGWYVLNQVLDTHVHILCPYCTRTCVSCQQHVHHLT